MAGHDARSDDRSPHGWIEPDPLGHGHVHHVASESIGECERMAGIGASCDTILMDVKLKASNRHQFDIRPPGRETVDCTVLLVTDLWAARQRRFGQVPRDQQLGCLDDVDACYLDYFHRSRRQQATASPLAPVSVTRSSP